LGYLGVVACKNIKMNEKKAAGRPHFRDFHKKSKLNIS